MKQQRKQTETLKQHVKVPQTMKQSETAKIRQNSETTILTTHENNF